MCVYVCVLVCVFTATFHSKFANDVVFISVSIEVRALRVLYFNSSMHIYPCNYQHPLLALPVCMCVCV